ncbi:hypothetical protein EST38_g4658 [Candolleomyces aberdarensis]|uniref:Uncharacterized protein n=1 Tax=Candolleomyces aberdarensis TaxID=2316362 RepID=A0A4Q2DQF0_9AGAR|nr:hypothetical protein EST38_g4658 [Candolleomyces aberdarensis]
MKIPASDNPNAVASGIEGESPMVFVNQISMGRVAINDANLTSGRVGLDDGRRTDEWFQFGVGGLCDAEATQSGAGDGPSDAERCEEDEVKRLVVSSSDNEEAEEAEVAKTLSFDTIDSAQADDMQSNEQEMSLDSIYKDVDLGLDIDMEALVSDEDMEGGWSDSAMEARESVDYLEAARRGECVSNTITCPSNDDKEMYAGGVYHPVEDEQGEIVDCNSSMEIIVSRVEDAREERDVGWRDAVVDVDGQAGGLVVVRSHSIDNVVDEDSGEVVARSYSIENVVDDGELGLADNEDEEVLMQAKSTKVHNAKRKRRKFQTFLGSMSKQPPQPTSFPGSSRLQEDSVLRLGDNHESDGTIQTTDGDQRNDDEEERVPPSPKYPIFSDASSTDSVSEEENGDSSVDRIPGLGSISDPTVVRGRDLANAVEVIVMYANPPPGSMQKSNSWGVEETTEETPSAALRRSKRIAKRPPKNVRTTRDPGRVRIQALVCDYAFTLMKRKKIACGVSPITSVTSSRAMRFFMQPEHGPTAVSFQLFLDFDSLESAKARKAGNAWNRRAGEVFVESFIGEHPEEAELDGIILSCFMTHIKQLRKQFDMQVMQEEEDEAHVAAMHKAAKEQLR